LAYFFNLFDIQSEEEKLEYGDITGLNMIDDLAKIMNFTGTLLEDIPAVLKYVRNQCPRLHFFSDAQTLQILTMEAEPDEIALHFLWGFPGIKKLEIPQKGDYIEAVTTSDNHLLKFTVPIFLTKELDKSNFFILKAINELEKEIKDSFKTTLSQHIKTIMKYPYDFYEKFKQSKKHFLQMIQLCQDVQFYHDITIMLAIADRHDIEPKMDDIIQKLIMFKETLNTNLKKFIENQEFKTASDRMFYMRYCQYIFQIKNHIEIIEYFISTKTESLETFEYLSLPKPMIEYNIEPIRSKNPSFVDITLKSIKKFFHTISTPDEFALFNDSSEYMKFCTQNIYGYDIVIRSMNYRIKYGYELTDFVSPIVHTPTTQRCFISMIGALATKTGSIINGSKHTGKVETIRVS
jgi:golgin subfamily B member 1